MGHRWRGERIGEETEKDEGHKPHQFIIYFSRYMCVVDGPKGCVWGGSMDRDVSVGSCW